MGLKAYGMGKCEAVSGGTTMNQKYSLLHHRSRHQIAIGLLSFFVLIAISSTANATTLIALESAKGFILYMI